LLAAKCALNPPEKKSPGDWPGRAGSLFSDIEYHGNCIVKRRLGP
jgi:hypothetical protein